MLKILLKIFFYLVIPAMLMVGIRFSSAKEILDGPSDPKLPKPYIIDEVLADGSIGNEYKGVSQENSLYEIAVDLGASPFKEDKINSMINIEWEMGSKITLYRAPVYSVIDGKNAFRVRSWADTVGELLSEQDIELGREDKINFSSDFLLSNGLEIKIVRVKKTEIVESEEIDYKTIEKPDSDLEKGKKRYVQYGKSGVKNLIYEVIREDGVEVSRKLLRTEIAKQPQDEIVYYGTKPVITVACRFDNIVIKASQKYELDPNDLCYRMMKESGGNPNSDGGHWKGLFQYSESLWQQISPKAGYFGASIWDATAQIYVTAWAWTHGYRSRWPNP